MSLDWARGEFRVELDTNEPRVIFYLNNFHKLTVRGCARQRHAGRFHLFTKVIIEFIAMAVALPYCFLAVSLIRATTLLQDTVPASQPHSATFLLDNFLVFHDVDHAGRRMRVVFIKLFASGLLNAKHVASIFYSGELHTEANA